MLFMLLGYFGYVGWLYFYAGLPTGYEVFDGYFAMIAMPVG
jgi:hypothetical protein